MNGKNIKLNYTENMLARLFANEVYDTTIYTTCKFCTVLKVFCIIFYFAFSKDLRLLCLVWN